MPKRRQADVRLVDLLADDAKIAGEVVHLHFAVGEGFALERRLIVDARVQLLERIAQARQHLLKLLRLLLQHADVGFELLVLAVDGGGRSRPDADRQQ